MFDENGGTLETFDDGTAHFYGVVWNDQSPTYGWEFDVWFKQRKNWTQWSSLGRGWKGDADIVGSNYLDWDYYVMDEDQSNTLIGLGGFDGDSLQLSHRPSDLYYGMQVGIAANDQNDEPGMSFWFNYSGELDGEDVQGNGDFNLEGDCFTPPVLLCDTEVEIDCGATLEDVEFEAPLLNCDQGYALSYTDDIISTECPIEITRTWKAISVNGDTVVCVQSVLQADTEGPQILTDSLILEGCALDGEFAFDVIDDCSELVDVAYEVLESGWNAEEDVCTLDMVLEVTATDACGNVTVANVNVIAEDISSPIVTDFESQISADCGNIPAPELNWEDPCFADMVELSVEELEFSGACLPTLSRIYTLTDQCGSVQVFEQYISLDDNESPVFVNSPENLALNCGDEIPLWIPEVSDNCSDVQIEMNETSESMACGSLVERTWTAMDDCGNVASISQLITIEDNEGPVADALIEDQTGSCGGGMEAPIVTFTDACGVVASVVFDADTISNTNCALIINRTWTATDDCGNETVVSQQVQYTDEEPPVFVSFPDDITLDCGADATVVEPVAIDNCGEVTITMLEQWVDGNGCAQLMRTWVATDDCGNMTLDVQMITFTDSEQPQILGVPANVSASCGDWPEVPEVTATDNCGTPNLSFNESYTEQDCGGILSRTWSAVDGCGNTAIAMQTVTFSDETAPVVIGLAEVTASCVEADGGALIDVEDDCDSNPEVMFTDEVSMTGCSYDITRNYTVTDACGNATTFVQLIHVIDDIPPVFVSVPANMQVQCEAPSFLESPIVEDACSSFEIEYMEQTTYVGCADVITRTWIATDACGNISSAEQVITVEDTEAPTFDTTPSNVSIECGDSMPEIPVMTATDNCSAEPAILYFEEMIAGDCEGEEVMVRTWVASDDCGNQEVVTQEVQIVDTTGPVFDNQPEDITVDCGNIPDPAVLTATDACSGEATVLFEQQNAAGGCPNITRVWVATDACGNTTMVVQNIFVEDNEPPLFINAPDDISADCNSIPEMPVPEVSDNCDDDVSVIVNESVVGEGCNYTIIRTWIAEDDCGNSTMVSQSITVEDTQAPQFIDPVGIVQVDCGELQDLGYPDVMDDCGNQIDMTYTDVVEDGACAQTITRTYQAIDLCGNTAEFVQTIYVSDNSGPELVGLPDSFYMSCGEFPEAPLVTAVDACNGATTVVLDEQIIGSGCTQTMIRTWTATDACGNTTSASRQIFMSDDEAPTFSYVPADLYVDCNNELPELDDAMAIDNCSENVTISLSELTENTSCGYVMFRTWVATDECGNTNSATQEVHHYDMTPPVITFIDQELFVDCGNIPALETPMIVDDCHPDEPITTFMQETVMTGACPYTIERQWTAIDICGNVSVSTQLIFVTDSEAPVLTGVPTDVTVDCQDVPVPASVSATDNCSDVEVTMTEEVIGEGCSYTLVRTWTATDLCGNAVSQSQNIMVEDNLAPVFVSFPEDVVLSCGESADPEFPVAADNCGSVEISYYDEVLDTGCGSQYDMIRHWMAQDACGNTVSQSQMINVVDDTPPMLSILPGDTVVYCNGVPEMSEIVAFDECDGDVEIMFTEDINWLEEANDNCVLGNAVSLAGDVALLLPGIEGVDAEYIFGEAGGLLELNPAMGTAHITGLVHNVENANQMWYIDIQLINELDWDAWSALGRSYKDDAEVAGDSYLDWSYFILDSTQSSLTGMGDFEGSTLSLTHAPSSYMFGFQMGWAANNRNDAYGMSGWFFYEGYLQGEYVKGMGDVLTENNCCAAHEITCTWTAIDCAGNVVTHTQLIEVSNDFPFDPTDLVYPEEQPDPALQVSNSTGDTFKIEATAQETGNVDIVLRDMNGKTIEKVYTGRMVEGQKLVLYHAKGALPNGMYLFTMEGNHEVYADRELVGR